MIRTENKIYVNGEEYRYIKVRGRAKYVSKNGCAINPYHRNQKATTHTNKDGYLCYGGGIPVHLYVAYAWVDGWFEGAEVNHKDFNRCNPNADNLEWVSHKQNILHTASNTNHYSIGNSGVNNGRAKFTIEEIEEIKKLFAQNMTTTEVIRYFNPNITTKTIKKLWSTYNNIKIGKTWKNI